MKFKDIIRTEEGTMTFNVEPSQEEVSFLVNHAVNDLIATGVIALNSMDSEQEVSIRSSAH